MTQLKDVMHVKDFIRTVGKDFQPMGTFLFDGKLYTIPMELKKEDDREIDYEMSLDQYEIPPEYDYSSDLNEWPEEQALTRIYYTNLAISILRNKGFDVEYVNNSDSRENGLAARITASFSEFLEYMLKLGLEKKIYLNRFSSYRGMDSYGFPYLGYKVVYKREE